MYPARPSRPHSFFDTPSRDLDLMPLPGFPRALRVHVRELGDPEAPPLVLIHGLMTSSYSWRYVLEPLARRFRVIVPDLPSAGRSEQAEDFPYTLKAFGECIAALVRACCGGRKPLVAANSLGGLQALRFALDHQDMLAGLVVIHCPGHPERKYDLLHHAIRIPPLAAGFSLFTRLRGRRFVPMVQRYHDQGILSGEEIDEYGRLFRTLAGSLCFTRIMRECLSVEACARLRADLGRAAPGLPWPLTLIWGQEDKLIPVATADVWRALAPQARFVAVPGSGHFVQVEAPEVVVREIERLVPPGVASG